MVIQPHLPAGQTQNSVWVYLRRVEVVLAVMLLCELNTGGNVQGFVELHLLNVRHNIVGCCILLVE